MSTSSNTINRVKKAWGEGRFTWKSVVAVTLFSAIILVFVFFGMHSGNTSSGLSSAARVNNALITVSDYEQELARIEQMWSMFGQVTGDQRSTMQRSTIERLVTAEIAAQSAAKSGIFVADKEVLDIITKEITAFHQDGRFNRELYVGILNSNRMTPGEFERKLRKERQAQRVQSLIDAVAQPTTVELAKHQAMQGMQLNVRFVSMDRAKLLEQAQGANAEEKASNLDAKLQELQVAVEQGDETKLAALIRDLKLKWEETGYFDLSSPFVPQLSSMVASEAAMEVTKERPLLRRVVKEGDKSWVMQYKDMKKSDKPALDVAAIKTQLARDKSMALYMSWVDKERQSAVVTINPLIFTP